MCTGCSVWSCKPALAVVRAARAKPNQAPSGARKQTPHHDFAMTSQISFPFSPRCLRLKNVGKGQGFAPGSYGM